jgi:hypothetical protein
MLSAVFKKEDLDLEGRTYANTNEEGTTLLSQQLRTTATSVQSRYSNVINATGLQDASGFVCLGTCISSIPYDKAH